MKTGLSKSSPPGLSRWPRLGRAYLREMAGHRRAKATPFFERLRPAMARRGAWLIVSAVLALIATPSHAQYPDRLIKIVSPAPPGGSTDIVARLVLPGLQSDLQQTVIVEARGGAGGYIGSEFVTKAPADGHTLLIGGAFVAITAALQKNPSYSPRRDLVPVAILASVPNVLVAGPRLKTNSVAELLAMARTRPGDLNIGSNGVGTTLHLSGELFKLQTNVKLEHIAYRGWADCVAALANGEIDMMFDNLSTALPNITAGKTRALATAAPTRHRALPQVPTLAEAGVNNAEVMSWFGIMVHADTPQPIVDRLRRSLQVTADTPEFQRAVRDQGMDVTFHGGADAVKFWHAEIDKWQGVIKAAGIVAQ
jgi:tripartite-type tricarboxylate transporter receptor subunit TctC